MNYPQLKNLNSASCREIYIKTHYPEFYQFLLDNYGHVETHPERLYWFYNNLKEYPLCHCGNRTKFINIHQGYRINCSSKCTGLNPDVIKAKKQTSLKKYGVENPAQCINLKSNYKQTCLEKYGVDNYFKTLEFVKKRKKTCLEKYGTEHHLQNDSIKSKLIDTIREKNINSDNTLIGYNEEGMQIRKCCHPECDKCQEKTYIIPANIYYDRLRLNCEVCTNLLRIGIKHDSTFEQKIKELLDAYNIKYIRNDRTILNPKELDFYLPDYNLAIECNGIWAHSTINNLDPKSPSYHKNKSYECSKKGIQLLHIWEDWYIYKWDIVKSILLNKLGLNQYKLYARKCAIKQVPKLDCNKFLDENHIQGHSNSEINLGLYYNNELVSLMCFYSKNSRIKEQWELVRFCSKLNTTVIGGADKLFQYFIKNYHPESIASFSMNDFSKGDIYNKLGFKSGNINNVYWYFEPRTLKRDHRSCWNKSSIVKKKIKDKIDGTWTEIDTMKSLNYFQIYDSGQTKWVWENKKDLQ